MQKERSLADQITSLLQGIDHMQKDEDQTQKEDREPYTDFGTHMETGDEPVETIHVYFVRESELEPPEEQVIDSHLAASEVLPEQETEYPLKQSLKKPTIPLVVLLALAVNVLIVFGVVMLDILPQLTASVSIILVPVGKEVTTTATITAGTQTPGIAHVPARLLPLVTLTQSKTAPATGHGHQNAKQATGTITFYNGLFVSQTVAAGTTLTGADGIQVVTDQLAIIPAANPPNLGQATVTAHTVQTGSQGNIPAYDINTSCCLTAVKAVNTASFQGGQSQRDYTYVTKSDVQDVAAALTPPLTQSIHAALQAQIITNEGLATLPCNPTTSTDHHIGEEAREVNVTVSERCTGVAYDEAALQSFATQLLTQQAVQQLGTSYSLVGAIQTSVVSATITDQKQGIVRITMKASGTWFYQLSSGQAQQMKSLIAGKSKMQGKHLLLSMPGIQGVTMQGLADNQRIPTNISHIHLLVVYGAS